MRLVDTHCHLQDHQFDEDRAEVVTRARKALEWVVVIGDSLHSSRAAADLAGDQIFAAVGVHPYHPQEADEGGLQVLRQLAARRGVVAIGEIGLDYYKYNDAPPALQKAAFAAQLRLAAELALPVVIHNRNADDDIFAMLNEHDAKLTAVIMHCFSGNAAFAERCMSRGYFISFAGNVTYPKAEPLRASASAVPIERLLVETDSPYLAPQPVRGKRCEPAYVSHTAATLARLKNVDLDEFAARTTENAIKIFRSEANR